MFFFNPLCLQIYLRFMEYQMEHSNECKKNFVAVYDGSSAIENLKAKFCSTVANDVMLDNGVGVVRMWADEKSRLSRFRMLFTSFVDRKFQSSWQHNSAWTLIFILFLSSQLNCHAYIWPWRYLFYRSLWRIWLWLKYYSSALFLFKNIF